MTSTHKRLAVFLPSLAGGGAEKSLLRLTHGLGERGYSVDLVLSRAEGVYKHYVAAMPKSVHMVDLKVARVLASIPALVQYMRREQPYALLSTLDYANVVTLWARRLAGVTTKIAVLEQNTISTSSQHSPQWRQRMVPRLAKRYYPWADFIIGNSQGVADDLVKVTGLASSRIRVIFNPVVTSELKEQAKVWPDHPWFEAGHLPVLLAVGRLTAQKDFPTLIRAFARVRKFQPIRLLILGEGPDRRKLESLIRDMQLEKDVKLNGFVENPCSFMARSSLFVLSSRWEGLPTVLIEALACGVPVIATDCPSGPGEILAGGKFGALVPVGDVNALASAIELALNGGAIYPTEESWRSYTLENVVDQYLNLLVGSDFE